MAPSHRPQPGGRPASDRHHEDAGTFRGGNQRSHCAASPGSQPVRGVRGVRPADAQGRSRRTLSRNQVIDPVQPIRSAITVAGTSGVFTRSCRTNGSDGVNAVGTAGRSYFGGPSEANARAIVDARPRDRVRPAAEHRPRPALVAMTAGMQAVAMECRPARRDSRPLTVGREDDGIEIRVSDRGPSIDTALVDTNFQRGHRRTLSTGQGLGLHIAHRLMFRPGRRSPTRSGPTVPGAKPRRPPPRSGPLAGQTSTNGRQPVAL
jgi:hypothetical protein